RDLIVTGVQTCALPISFPAIAWHVAGQAARRAPRDQASVVTTIESGLQTRLDKLAAQAAQSQGPQATAAIVVVEVKTRAVRALRSEERRVGKEGRAGEA